MSQTFDAVIVGAGIMGCATAYELAQRGRKVVVLEKGSVGGESTGKSSAIIRQHYSNELTARMALHSLRVFQEFRERVGDECGFRQTGFVALAAEKDRRGLEANVALQQRVGIDTRVCGADALRAILPGMAFDDLAAAAFEPESGYADPHLTVGAYVEAAKRHGTVFQVGSEVTGIRFAGPRVAGVDTAGGAIDAPCVLNCAGPWGARVAALAGVDAPVNSCRIQVATFKRPAEHAAEHPVVVDFVHGTYFRSETGDLTLAGLIDPSEADAIVDPDRYDERLDDDFVPLVGERFVARYPPMDRSESRGGYAGLYAITPDWHPIVDEVPSGSGHFLCTGFSGHGFKLGPAVGVMLADMVTGADAPTFDPRLFRLSRFADDAPVRGQYEYSIAG